MKEGHLLRWLAVLPGAILAVIAANFLLHWILMATLHSESIDTPHESVERFLLPFAAGAAFIAAGVYIAPTAKRIVGISLAALLLGAWSAYFFLWSS